MTPEIEDISDYIIRSISNALKENNQYPWSRIHSTSHATFFEIMIPNTLFDDVVNPKVEQMQKMIEKLPKLCAKHNIKMTGPELATTKSIKIGEKTYTKFALHLASSDLHNLFMSESPQYVGYHESGSILRLAEPERTLLKPPFICLFPIYCEDDFIIIRTAGCNAENTVATQLAFYVKKYLNTSLTSNDAYGHHNNHILEAILHLTSDEFMTVAFSYIGKDNINPEKIEGHMTGPLDKKYVKPMTPEAYLIYQELSAENPNALKKLASFEVPAYDFFKQLALIKTKKLEHLKTQEALFKKMDKNELLTKSTQDITEHLMTMTDVLSQQGFNLNEVIMENTFLLRKIEKALPELKTPVLRKKFIKSLEKELYNAKYSLLESQQIQHAMHFIETLSITTPDWQNRVSDYCIEERKHLYDTFISKSLSCFSEGITQLETDIAKLKSLEQISIKLSLHGEKNLEELDDEKEIRPGGPL